jgi:hypothetical protein
LYENKVFTHNKPEKTKQTNKGEGGGKPQTILNKPNKIKIPNPKI